MSNIDRDNGLPGPGAYNSKLSKGIGYSIGRAKRSKSQGGNRIGPGNYDLNYNVTGNIFYFFQGIKNLNQFIRKIERWLFFWERKKAKKR